MEFEKFNAKYRAVLRENKIKLFTPNDEIIISNQINFDIKSTEKSSLDYFASSLLGGVLAGIYEFAKFKKIAILEMEGKIKFEISNSLTILNVIGYDDSPKIELCEIKIYISSDMSDDEFSKFTNEALKRNLIYQNLQNSLNLDIKFEQII